MSEIATRTTWAVVSVPHRPRETGWQTVSLVILPQIVPRSAGIKSPASHGLSRPASIRLRDEPVCLPEPAKPSSEPVAGMTVNLNEPDGLTGECVASEYGSGSLSAMPPSRE